MVKKPMSTRLPFNEILLIFYVQKIRSNVCYNEAYKGMELRAADLNEI